MSVLEEDVKKIISNNLIELRKASGLKQSELAEKLNYSDKTISKWENADCIPDVTTLCEIASLYGITVNDILKEDASKKINKENLEYERQLKNNKIVTLSLSSLIVLMIATMIFVYLMLKEDIIYWQAYTWAIPACAIVLFLLEKRVKGKFSYKTSRYFNLITLSVFCWTFVAGFYFQFLQHQLWMLFFLCVPMQAIIILNVWFKK